MVEREQLRPDGEGERVATSRAAIAWRSSIGRAIRSQRASAERHGRLGRRLVPVGDEPLQQRLQERTAQVEKAQTGCGAPRERARAAATPRPRCSAGRRATATAAPAPAPAALQRNSSASDGRGPIRTADAAKPRQRLPTPRPRQSRLHKESGNAPRRADPSFHDAADFAARPVWHWALAARGSRWDSDSRSAGRCSTAASVASTAACAIY